MSTYKIIKSTTKRNSLIKSFENYKIKDLSTEKREELEKKYDQSYTVYLEALDKYVMDSIYKKVKNNTAEEFEKQALSKYYGIVQLKESEHVEYKYRKQKYLLELDKVRDSLNSIILKESKTLKWSLK